MPFSIIRNDITKVAADAIVNTANPRPVVGGGTDTAVYRAAGRRRLLAERKKIGEIAPGQAVFTPAFRLPAKYVIHTVGPVWEGGGKGERETLRACYAHSLALADSLGCESVAFPLIATGSYGFPKDEALEIALSEIGRFLLTHEMLVTLVVFDDRSFALSEGLAGEIEQFIDSRTARSLHEAEYGGETVLLPGRTAAPAAGRSRAPRKTAKNAPPDNAFFGSVAADADVSEKAAKRQQAAEREDLFAPDEPPETAFADAALPSAPMPSAAFKEANAMPALFPQAAADAPFAAPDEAELDRVLDGAGQTFQQKLFELIDASGMDDVTVYKKANIDRKVFSRIRCKADYRPKKKTAVAFAIALELDMPAMLDLLARAEIAFSPSSKFDLIVTYFITHHVYDVFEINAALFKYGQPILGE